jgi:hypothetical protein
MQQWFKQWGLRGKVPGHGHSAPAMGGQSPSGVALAEYSCYESTEVLVRGVVVQELSWAQARRMVLDDHSVPLYRPKPQIPPLGG